MMHVAANGRPLSPVPSLCLHWRVVRRPSDRDRASASTPSPPRSPARNGRFMRLSVRFKRPEGRFQGLGECQKRPARKRGRKGTRDGPLRDTPAQRRSQPSDGETPACSGCLPSAALAQRRSQPSDGETLHVARARATCRGGRSDDLNPRMVRLVLRFLRTLSLERAQRRSQPSDGETLATRGRRCSRFVGAATISTLGWRDDRCLLGI